MMIKLRIILLLILSTSLSLVADDCFDWSLQLRGAYFASQSKIINKTNSQHWFDYQVEAAHNFENNWQLWTNVSWFTKKRPIKRDAFYGPAGHYHDSSYCRYSTNHNKKHRRLYILPLSLGLKYNLCITPCARFYLGAGPSYTFLKIKHPISIFNKYITRQGIGALFKSGFQYDIGEYTFLDLFVDYLYQRFHFSQFDSYIDGYTKRKQMNIGGFKIGIGLGVYF